jgi:hypothetical protein
MDLLLFIMTLLVSRPHSDDVDMISECGLAGGIRIRRGNRSARRKRAPVLLFPPQNPHYLT